MEENANVLYKILRDFITIIVFIIFIYFLQGVNAIVYKKLQITK